MWNISAGRSAIIALLGTDWAYSASMTDRLWPLFALGAAAYIFRSRIRLSWAMLALLFIINVVAHQWGVGLHVRAIFIGYALLCRSEEHTSELQSLMRISYAVFFLKK